MKSFISIEHFPMNMYASISVNGNLSEAVWMNCRCVMTLGLFGIDVLSVTQAYFIYLRKDEDCFAASISTLFHIIFGFASGTTTCLLYCDSWHFKNMETSFSISAFVPRWTVKGKWVERSISVRKTAFSAGQVELILRNKVSHLYRLKFYLVRVPKE